MIALMLFTVLGGWLPGLIEQHTYKLAESSIPGTSTYTLTGMLRNGEKVLEVHVETHRVMTLGGQKGKLDSNSYTWIDPVTYDLLESKLFTTLNGVEASYLHAMRKGTTIEVYQKLRGSPVDIRTVQAPGVAIDENALNFFLERTAWTPGKVVEWQRYSPTQSRLIPNKGSLEKAEKDKLRVKVETDIGPTIYDIRPGKEPVVLRIETVGTEQMRLVEPK